MGRAFVEGHDDIRTQHLLDLHRCLRTDKARHAIKMVLEMHALRRDLAQLGQREDLESPAIREDRTIPAHEFVQPAELADDIQTRPDKKMVGVAEDDLGAQFVQFARTDRFDRALRPHRHEDRCLDRPTPGLQGASAGTRRGVASRDLEVCAHSARRKMAGLFAPAR